MGLKLMAEIGLDGSGFERGLRKVGSEAAASVKNLAVQAFGIYGVEQAIAKTVETATELVNESKRLDVTVEQLQLLRQAAKDGGTEMGTLASAFEKLDIARAKALSGDKAAIAAFAKLGVTQAQLTTQTAATIFTGPISNAAKNNNVESLAPALKEVLGKGFGELIPVLKTDFDELGDKMKALGSIMDTDTAVKLKALSDNFDLLKNILTVQLGPVLVQFAIWLLEAVGKIKAFGSFLGAISEKGTVKGAASLASEMLNTPVGKFLSTVLPGGMLHKFLIDKVAGPDKDKLITQGGAAMDEAEKSFDKMIDALKAALQKQIDDLSHPKPIVPAVTPPPAEKQKTARVAQQTDSLLRVGNFLAANGNTISRVDQQKITLLKKIADNTTPKATFGTNFGIPPV